MSSFQKSVWSSDLSSTINYNQSFNKDINNSVNYNHWNIDIETNENREEHFNKTGVEKWSCIGCFIIGLLLGGIALAIVMTLWLAPSKNSITSTVSSSTTTSTISTVTTTTSTTTSTTTQTTTTTSATTTTTTPIPPCPPTSVGSSSIIYNTSSGNQASYECYAFLWTSNMTGSVNLTFQIQNLPYYWLMDDVSVNNGAVEMLSNGGFESGSLSPWIRTDPYGPCGGSAGQVSNGSSHSGSYNLLDGSDKCPDFISQAFPVTSGQIYTISFWLKVVGSGPSISIVVFVS